jgi:gamma-glutamylaminecyclotransferase
MRSRPVHQVFVYGTLKEGFANFGINAGRRVPGVFRTVEKYPLYIVGAIQVPWLVNEPGRGEHVIGQVFEIDDPVLADMDRLERVDEPGWYTRVTIEVHAVEMPEAASRRVFVYFGAAERVATDTVHAGPLAEFTAEHNSRYRRVV